MIHRPSSLPKLAKCAQFIGGEGGRDLADRGILRHKYFAALLKSEAVTICDQLTDEERDGVAWAVDYVRSHANMSSWPLEIESKLKWDGADFEPRRGTADVKCGNEIFDLKWEVYDYEAQMADYACGLLQRGHSMVTTHLLFAKRKSFQIQAWTQENAEKLVGEILKRAGKADATPCEYCGWCARQMTCPALTAKANEIASVRENVDEADKEAFDRWLQDGAHASSLEDEAVAGRVLRIAREIKGWCESVEHHAKELAEKRGIVPSGFKIQSRQGNRFVRSVAEAYPLSGLPQTEFLAACEVKLSTLSEAYAAFHQLKKAQAERDLTGKLGDVIQRKASTISLVEEK
jgi:hypothetical protein